MTTVNPKSQEKVLRLRIPKEFSCEAYINSLDFGLHLVGIEEIFISPQELDSQLARAHNGGGVEKRFTLTPHSIKSLDLAMAALNTDSTNRACNAALLALSRLASWQRCNPN